MTWQHVLGALILATLVGCWLVYTLVVRRDRQRSTPWADSTKVAAEVRRMRDEETA